MKFLFVQVVFSVLCSIVALGQGSISGSVSDEQGSPLADVNVWLPHPGKGTTTDKLGRFKIKDIDGGAVTMQFTSVGYRSQQKEIDVPKEGEVIVQIAMEEGELVLADVVVTDRITSEVNTISQIDINLRPVNTSQDILRMVPGLFIAQHAGGGKAEQIFLRGFDIDHGTDINLEVDGMPVNMVSHAHGQGYSDLHFLIPEIVGTVDFNKGPYYADKGNLNTAGYVSFHTLHSLDESMVKVEGGKFGMFRNVNAFNVFDSKRGDWRSNAFVASEYFRSDGYFEANQHFNRINLFGKYNAWRDGKEAITVGISTFNSRWDASGQIPGRAVQNGTITRFGSIDPTEGGETSRTNFWVKYLKSNSKGGVFENQLHYSKYDFNLISNFTFFLNDPVNGDQITQRESRSIYGYKGSYFIDTQWRDVTIRSEVGAGFRYDDVNDIQLYHTRARHEFLEDVARGDIDETNLYAYVNETISLSPALSVSAGIRFDHFTFNYVDALASGFTRQSVSKPMLTPKFNVSYSLSHRLSLFAKGGIGFHSNDTRVVVARQGYEVLPKAYGLDVGGNVKMGSNLLFTAALWLLDLDQEFVYVGDEGIVEPSGKTTRRGIDFSIRYQPLPWLYIDSDVNVTDPRAKDAPEGEDYIPLAPTFTTIGGLSTKLKNGFNGSIRYRYLSNRAANEDNSVVADGYFLLDAVAKFRKSHFEIFMSAENLLNTKWNEAQFDTESRLMDESSPVSEIHFTPGTPLFIKAGISFFF